MYDFNKSLTEQIPSQQLNKRGIKLFVKRDDLIHQLVSGNKWRKLKYNIESTINSRQEGIITFGGAYSNHLLATAVACYHAGLKAVGIVRGEELHEASNTLLQHCSTYGMKLHFVSRDSYRYRNEKSFQEELLSVYSNMRLVPEGGANYQGILGCMEILPSCGRNFDHVFVAQGTTATSCGVLLSLPNESTLHVIPVLKAFDSIHEMNDLLLKSAFDESIVADLLDKVIVHEEAHFGGYGKYTLDLLEFMENFFSETQIPLDPIYTGKAMKAIYDWIDKEDIADCSILFIHTGGIEGGRAISVKEGRLFANFN